MTAGSVERGGMNRDWTDAAGRAQIRRNLLVCATVHGNIVECGELERNRGGRGITD